MEQNEYATVATLGSVQEIATRALMIAAGEDIASRSATEVAEDVSVRIAKHINKLEG